MLELDVDTILAAPEDVSDAPFRADLVTDEVALIE